jgi:hypothetical protein
VYDKRDTMPRKKMAPSDKMNIRAPPVLQQEVIDLLLTGKSDYRDFSDFVIGALRKEVEFQKRKIAGLTGGYEATIQPPARP